MSEEYPDEVTLRNTDYQYVTFQDYDESVKFDSWDSFVRELDEGQKAVNVVSDPAERQIECYAVVYLEKQHEKHGVADYNATWTMDRDSLYMSKLAAEQYACQQIKHDDWKVLKTSVKPTYNH